MFDNASADAIVIALASAGMGLIRFPAQPGYFNDHIVAITDGCDDTTLHQE